MYDIEKDREQISNSERKCANCISGMPIKNRERKRKCNIRVERIKSIVFKG